MPHEIGHIPGPIPTPPPGQEGRVSPGYRPGGAFSWLDDLLGVGQTESPQTYPTKEISGKPEKGNLRKNTNGIWEAYNSKAWVPIIEYYKPETGGRTSIDDQRRALSELMTALYAMDVRRVTGTNLRNYRYFPAGQSIGLDEEGEPAFRGVTGLNNTQLLNLTRSEISKGTLQKADFTGDLSKYQELLGWPVGPSAFYKEFAVLDDQGNQVLQTIERDGIEVTTPKTEFRFDSETHGRFINEVKTYLGLLGDTAVSHTLSDGRRITSFRGKHYVESPTRIGGWSATTVNDDDGNPRFIGVTDPSGKHTMTDIGSQSASEYTLLAKQQGGDVSPRTEALQKQSREAGLQDLAAGATVQGIVPGYDAVQTSAGKYQLVKSQPDAQVPIGSSIPLPDGRYSVKVSPDKYEIVTPASGAWFVDDWGNSWMRDDSGSMQKVEAPTIDEQINRALIEGNAELAINLSDFRDRPTAQERFQLALDYARSPGDLMAISKILGGLVDPEGPTVPGSIRRIPPPEWVTTAWNQLQSSWGVKDEDKNAFPGVSKDVSQSTINEALSTGEHIALQEQSEDQRIRFGASMFEREQQAVSDEISRTNAMGGEEPTDPVSDATRRRDIWNQRYPSSDQMFDPAPGNVDPTARPTTTSTSSFANAMGTGLGGRTTDNTTIGTETGDLEFTASMGDMPDYQYGYFDEGYTPYYENYSRDRGALNYSDYDRARGQNDAFHQAQKIFDDAGLKQQYVGNHAAQQAINYVTRTLGFFPGNPDFVQAVVARATELALGGQEALNNADLWDKANSNAHPSAMSGWSELGGKPFNDLSEVSQEMDKLRDEGNLSPPGAGYIDYNYEDEGRIFTDAREASRSPRSIDETVAMEEMFAQEQALQRQEQARQQEFERTMQEDMEVMAPAFSGSEPRPGWRESRHGYSPVRYTEPTHPGEEEEPTFDMGEYTEPTYPGEEETPTFDPGQYEGPSPSGYESEQDDIYYEPTPEPDAPGRGGWEQEDFAEGGTTFRDTMALVGEEGPELVHLPAGTEVIPADFTEAMLHGRKAKRMANGGTMPSNLTWGDMAQVGGEGGEVIRRSDLERLRQGRDISNVPQYSTSGRVPGQTRAADPLSMDEASYTFDQNPYRVSQLMRGRPIAPTSSLFRPTGLTVPSAQAMRRLVPEEIESYRELGRLAGIPDKAFEREFQEAVPGGSTRPRQARMQARRMRRL